MPVKITFEVISCSGEDDRFRATELNYHGPTVRGWRSPVNCKFPQEIIIQLKIMSILHQIQILAHQYLIPQKIEICTSVAYEGTNNFSRGFEYLGFITFSDNKETEFRSRELKSIFIPAKKAKFIKLIIHSNHLNLKNALNQVALIAVNVLGDPLTFDYGDNETNNNVSFHSNTSPLIVTCNSNYISPYDDLAFEMYVDEETAKIMKILESKKYQAVCEERFDHANVLKITLENLRAAGEILGLYEQEKKQAINLEDFDKAKTKKLQIDNFRKKIYSALHINQLLASKFYSEQLEVEDEEEEEIISNENNATVWSNLQNKSPGLSDVAKDNMCLSDCKLSSKALQKSTPSSSFHQMIHSKSQGSMAEGCGITAPAYVNVQFLSSSTSQPQLQQYLRDTCKRKYNSLNFQENEDVDFSSDKTPSSISNSSIATESSPYKSLNAYAYSPEPLEFQSLNDIKTQNREKNMYLRVNNRYDSITPSESSRNYNDKYELTTSEGENKIKNKNISTSLTKSSFETYEERMLPALRSYHGNEIARKCQIAFEQPRKSTLNEKEKKQAALPISIFGIEMIEKFYSKSFTDKEEGLKQLQQELKNVANANKDDSGKKIPYNKIARAAIFLLHRALRDKVFSVYSYAAETVRLFFMEYIPNRVSSAEVARSVEKLLPELLTKSGDATPRVHNMAAHTLLSMAECEDVKRLNIIPVHLSRPLTTSTHPRLALSRLEMVEQLILNHGISRDKKSGLTSRTLAEFGSSGLHHPAEAVRKVSERILLEVYKTNPRIVRKQLPPDDNVTRRNLLYRQLFREFDLMDSQKKLEETTIESLHNELEIDKSLSASHVLSTQTDINSSCIENNYKSENVKNGLESKNINNFEKEICHKESNKSPAELKIYKPEQLNLKKKYSDAENKKEKLENIFKLHSSLRNGKTQNFKTANKVVKFPSLTDSLDTTKARMLLNQKENSVINTNYFVPKEKTDSLETHQNGSKLNNKSILKRNDGKNNCSTFSSNIPLPTFNHKTKPCASVNRSLEKAENSMASLKEAQIGFPNKSKIPKKDLKGKNRCEKILTISETENPNPQKLVRTPNKLLEKNFDIKQKEYARLSNSTKAYIKENESLLSCNNEESYENLKFCIFCLSPQKWTTEEGLNNHYLKDCLMLTKCEYCKEITEISGYTNHLLADCKQKNLFKKCLSCEGTVLKDLFRAHKCSGPLKAKTKCPFCLVEVGKEESCWRRHLTGKNTCNNHPRKLTNTVKNGFRNFISGMDPLFMSFSHNGVPQESKLATYMNHQNSSGGISTLSDALGSISLEQSASLSKDPVLLVRHDLSAPNSIRPLVASNNGESPSLTTSSPLRESPVLTSLISDSIVHPAPTYRFQVNQENVGGTTYFYPTTATGDSSPSTVSGFQGYAGNHGHLTQEESSLISPSPSFYVSETIRNEILEKSALTMLQPDLQLYPDLPETVDNYHELLPLEPLPIGDPLQIGLSSTYKATHIKTGIRYCLRRIHGFRLSSTKCMVLVDMWKRLSHTNIVQLKEVFTTKAFGDNSIVFVYDYHPGSETLWSRHFSSSESTGPTAFSSDPTAPRPYSHTKNTLLRHQHSSMLPENLLWNYIIQITAAVRVIHGAGLACRTLDPSKIIVSSRNRLRLSCTGVTDVLTPDSSVTNPLALIPHYQQEDLTSLGKLVLALACKSLLGVQRENIQTSLDLVGRTYSSDLKNLIVYLLHNQKRRTVTDLMPMIGARFYAQLETIQTHSDEMENELAKEMDNGRLCRLLAKLGTINERPELNLDPSWSETGDRYMLKLFRDYIFHQVTEDGRPWLEMSHIVQCLNKLDSGSPEKICLMSRDEQSVLVVSYEELKHCLEQSFNEVVSSATEKPPALLQT